MIERILKRIVWGMKEIGFSEQELMTWMEQFPDAWCVRPPDAGHYAQEEAPEELNQAMERFLQLPFSI